ncbi:putative phage abortive infection protein [Rhizobium sp. BK176]|uniref:putative phage abortive infection protein n=1 Tax=Rhizobium sp. BK176 TaxID=2587071 RepID=UPI00386787DD
MKGALYRKRVHVRYESTFGPYFRLLYTILWRLRDDKKLTPEEKRRYGNLLRGHLTSFEVAMAGLNGLMPRAKDFDAC